MSRSGPHRKTFRIADGEVATSRPWQSAIAAVRAAPREQLEAQFAAGDRQAVGRVCVVAQEVCPFWPWVFAEALASRLLGVFILTIVNFKALYAVIFDFFDFFDFFAIS